MKRTALPSNDATLTEARLECGGRHFHADDPNYPFVKELFAYYRRDLVNPETLQDHPLGVRIAENLLEAAKEAFKTSAIEVEPLPRHPPYRDLDDHPDDGGAPHETELIWLNRSLYFDDKKAELRADTFGNLCKIAGWLSQHRVTKVWLIGHSSRRGGNRDSNWILGLNRATAVDRALRDMLGAAQARTTIIPKSRGDQFSRPSSNGHTANTEQADRRVDVWVRLSRAALIR